MAESDFVRGLCEWFCFVSGVGVLIVVDLVIRPSGCENKMEMHSFPVELEISSLQIFLPTKHFLGHSNKNNPLKMKIA